MRVWRYHPNGMSARKSVLLVKLANDWNRCHRHARGRDRAGCGKFSGPRPARAFRSSRRARAAPNRDRASLVRGGWARLEFFRDGGAPRAHSAAHSSPKGARGRNPLTNTRTGRGAGGHGYAPNQTVMMEIRGTPIRSCFVRGRRSMMLAASVTPAAANCLRMRNTSTLSCCGAIEGSCAKSSW